jgi:hypothetical protein
LAEQATAQASIERAGLICFPECFIPGCWGTGKLAPLPDPAFPVTASTPGETLRGTDGDGKPEPIARQSVVGALAYNAQTGGMLWRNMADRRSKSPRA